MSKKHKGLVDDHEHGIILNESGTSVSFGWDANEENADDETTSQQEVNQEENNTSTGEKDNPDTTK